MRLGTRQGWMQYITISINHIAGIPDVIIRQKEYIKTVKNRSKTKQTITMSLFVDDNRRVLKNLYLQEIIQHL